MSHLRGKMPHWLEVNSHCELGLALYEIFFMNLSIVLATNPFATIFGVVMQSVTQDSFKAINQ